MTQGTLYSDELHIDDDGPLGLIHEKQPQLQSSVAVDVAEWTEEQTEEEEQSEQCESQALLNNDAVAATLLKPQTEPDTLLPLQTHAAMALYRHLVPAARLAMAGLSLLALLAAALYLAHQSGRHSSAIAPLVATPSDRCAAHQSSARPAVSQWRLCPPSHVYPALSQRARPPPIPPSPYANLTQGEQMQRPWPPQTALEWPVAAYPSVYLLDPVEPAMWQLFVYEAIYGSAGGVEGQGGWTVLVVAVPLRLDNGELYTGGQVHMHEQTPMLSWQLQPYITCGDSAADWQTRQAGVEMSWHWMKLHCPFARHPLTPQDVIAVDQPTDSSQQAISRVSLHFNHPLFVSAANNFSQLLALLDERKLVVQAALLNQSVEAGKATNGYELDWSVLLAQSGLRSDPLSMEVCLQCVAVVSVSLCSAPLLTDVMLNDVRSHIAYHVALGVERVHLFDRFGWYEAALSDYIAAGVVDYTRLPLPSRSVLGNRGDRHPHGLHWDQHLALEVCHMKQLGTAAWFIYKDFDEWLSFPPNTSFIDTAHLAQCVRTEQKQLPSLVQQAIGSTDGVVVSLQPPSSLSPSSASLSLYDYYQADTASAFRSFHLSSDGQAGLYSTAHYPCPSPLLAYLTAVSDVRNLQSVTYPAMADAPTAFRSPSHRLPLALPWWSTSSKDQAQPNDDEKAQGKRGIHAKGLPGWMLEWVGLCEHVVAGPESSDNSSASSAAPSLMIERFRQSYSQQPVNSHQWGKWIARPSVEGSMWVHGHIDQRRIRAEAPVTNAAYDDMVKRPCEEIRYLHYKNFPKARTPPPDNQQWETPDDVYNIHRRLQSMALSTQAPIVADGTVRASTRGLSTSAT